MYNIELNLTNGWEYMTDYSLDGVKLKRYRMDDSIRQRDKVDGSIKFYGDDVSKIQTMISGSVATLMEIDFRLYLDTTLLIEGVISAFGKYDQAREELSLDFLENDDYTELEKVMDNEAKNVEVYDLDYYPELHTRYFGHALDVTVPTPTGYSYCGDTVAPPNWDSTKAYQYAQEITTDLLWEAPTMNDSFVRYGNRNYVAVKNNINSQPGSAGNTDWVMIFGVTWFSQARSVFELDGYTYDEDLRMYTDATCSASMEVVKIAALDLFNTIEDLLPSGYSIDRKNYLEYVLDNFPDEGELAIYFPEDSETGNSTIESMKLSDILGIYKSVYNVEWRLENKELIFKHPSELNQALPGPQLSFPNYYINDVLGRDWSSSEFTYNIKDKVWRETFSIGKETTRIEYANKYTDEYTEELNEYSLKHNVVFSKQNRDNERLKGILAYSSTDQIQDELVLSTLINEHFLIDRPFDTGEVDGVSETLIQRYNNDCDISIAFTQQNLIDFDYLINSYYGTLYVNELSVSLDNAQTKISASRK